MANASLSKLQNRVSFASIKNKLEYVTALSAIEIEQKKSKNGAPSYYYKDILLTRSCSISHHGNYGVFSLLFP